MAKSYLAYIYIICKINIATIDCSKFFVLAPDYLCLIEEVCHQRFGPFVSTVVTGISIGIVFLYDNTWPHTAERIVLLQEFH